MAEWGQGSLIIGDGSSFFVNSVTAPKIIFDSGYQKIKGSLYAGEVLFAGPGNKEIVGGTNIYGDLAIEESAIAYNKDANYFSLTVEGDIVNNGSIQNNTSYGLYVYSSGNIENNGIWNNYRTYLTGNNIRTINGNPLGGNIYANDNFEMLGNPVFGGIFYLGATITLNDINQSITILSGIEGSGEIAGQGTLIMGDGSKFDGAYITAPKVIFSAGDQTMVDYQLTASEIIFKGPGTKTMAHGMTLNGNVAIEEGVVIQNKQYVANTVKINGNVENRGTIQDEGSDCSPYTCYFSLEVSGDIVNNGVWKNNRTYLVSNNARSISGTDPLRGNIIVNDDFTILNSPVFNGYFSLNNKTVALPNEDQSITILGRIEWGGTIVGQGSLIMADGSFFDGRTHITAPKIIFDTGNQNIRYYMTADEVQFKGPGIKTILTSTEINGNVVVDEDVVIQNKQYVGCELTVNGDIENNGTIQDEGTPWSYFVFLIMNISGNITNNGIWNNYRTNAVWDSISNADYYEFNITDDQNNWPTASIVYDNRYSIKYYINTSSYWRVRPIINGLPGEWSEVRTINEISRIPVLIIPGIIASYLNDAHTNEEIWPNLINMAMPGDDSYLNQLILPDNGISNENNIVVIDIFREIDNYDFFQDLITELENEGYEENKDLFVFPYDWRLDISYIAGENNNDPNNLANNILKIKNQLGIDKVDVIAHSMGGLVAKKYIHLFGTSSIDKFIDIASPHYGSPKAFKILQYGDDLGMKMFIFGLDSNRTQIISQNFPSIYQLLPSRDYFDPENYYYHHYIYDTADSIPALDYDASIDFMKLSGRNWNLLDRAQTIHDEIDDLYVPNSYNIVGCGVPTLGMIRVEDRMSTDDKSYNIYQFNGDGTVPLRSAMGFNAEKQYYVSGIAHAYLPSTNGVRQLIMSILNNREDNFDFSGFNNLSATNNICDFSGTQVSFHSPIDLHIYDESYNHVGPDKNGDIEMNIPGVTYDIIGHDKFAFLPAGRNYIIIGSSTDQGIFDARIQKIDNGDYEDLVYFHDISLGSINTKVKYSVDSARNIQNIEILKDSDGDGAFEETIEPSSVLSMDEARDNELPVTNIEISAEQAADGAYYLPAVIGFIANDNLSGVLNIKYSINSTSTWKVYDENNQPIIEEQGDYTIYYYGIDKAGNREKVKSTEITLEEQDCLEGLLDLFNNLYEEGNIKEEKKKDLLIHKLELIKQHLEISTEKKDGEYQNIIMNTKDFLERIVDQWYNKNWLTKDIFDIIINRIQCINNYLN